MTRSSKQLSSTLQELRVTRSSARLSRQTEEPDSPLNVKHTAPHSQKVTQFPSKSTASHPFLLQPLVMQFNILLQSLSVTAALLPSLQAQYKMDHVSSAGVSGNKAKFTIDLPNHSLSFTTKVHASEANTLPSEACIALPEIHVSAEYIPENAPQVSRCFCFFFFFRINKLIFQLTTFSLGHSNRWCCFTTRRLCFSFG